MRKEKEIELEDGDWTQTWGGVCEMGRCLDVEWGKGMGDGGWIVSISLYHTKGHLGFSTWYAELSLKCRTNYVRPIIH